MSNLIPVRVRDCACPDERHKEPQDYDGTLIDGDVVYMAPTISLAGGLAAERDTPTALAETMAAAGPPPPGGWSERDTERMAIDMSERLRQKLLVTYVRFGAKGWNFHDETGPIPFDVDVLLDDYALSGPVAEKGDELYGDAVTRPLLNRLASRSRRGPMDQSTSAKKTSTTKRPRRSSPGTTAASKRLSA